LLNRALDALATGGNMKDLQIHFTGRQMDVSNAMRQFVTEKLEKISKYWTSIQDISVTLSVEKYRHIAEIGVTGKPFSLNGMEVTSDMYASVGAVVEKLERQAKKQKEKIRDRKKVRGGKEAMLEKMNATYATEGGDDEADDGFSAGEEGDDLDGEAELPPRVVQSTRFEPKPLTLEEASLRLEDSSRSFIVYRDADSSHINVLYKSANGDFGLIDPDQ
jgi:putative sigma-54 modulation protein